MKAYKSTIIITSVITLLPILAGLFLWNRLPDTIATHFGFGGNPDGYSSKPFAIFGMPLFLLLMHIFCIFYTFSDPKKKNINGKILSFIFWIAPVVSLFCSLLIYGYALDIRFHTGFIGNLFVGILFLVIGNYLPKCRQNYTIGIRLPWTFNSEANWNRTHRLAGWIWMIGGAVLIVNAIFSSTAVVFITIIVIAFIPSVYSFVLYRKGI